MPRRPDADAARRAKKKRDARRVSAGGRNSETYVEDVGNAVTVASDLEEELFVDEQPRKKNGAKKKVRSSGAPRNNGERKKSGARKKKSGGKRAADRRRARGAQPTGPADGTDTSLQHPGEGAHGGDSGQLNYATGVLTCVEGPEEGLALNVVEGSYTIGRGRDNNFVLKDIAASRKHVEIVVGPAGVRVRDLGSGNGTRVNGRGVDETLLENGDRLEVGNSVMVFTSLGNEDSQLSSLSDPDAGDRIARAAEKLAAELSERLRAEDQDELDDDGPETATARKGSHRFDNHLVSNSGDEKPPMPEDLWNDAETHIPLSDVVPADQPLGSKYAARAPEKKREAKREKKASRPPPTPPPAAAQDFTPPGLAPPPPRREPSPSPPPTPAPLPPQRAQAYGVSAQPTQRGGGSVLPYVVLSVLIIALLGGTVFGVYWFVIREGKVSSSPIAAYNAAVADAALALYEQRHEEAQLLVRKALAIDPEGEKALKLRAEIQEALEADAAKEEDAPAPALDDKPEAAVASDAPDPGEAQEDAPAANEPPAKQDEAPAVAAAAEAPQDPPPEAREPEPTPAPKVTKPKPQPKPKRRRVKRTRRRPTPKPRPRGMSDDEAAKTFRQGIRLVRDDDPKGCRLIKKVAKQGPSGSAWKAKAENAVGRYGCD